jgi:ribosomal protein S18 acetylase RimI-like enzyme
MKLNTIARAIQGHIKLIDEGTCRIIGFSNGGCSRDNVEYDGELYAIYIYEKYQHRGIGKKLVQELVSTLKNNNYRSMMVWVLESNPAIGFYRNLGGKEFLRKEITIGSDVLIEVALGWKGWTL